jgi:hypothetical protein
LRGGFFVRVEESGAKWHQMDRERPPLAGYWVDDGICCVRTVTGTEPTVGFGHVDELLSIDRHLGSAEIPFSLLLETGASEPVYKPCPIVGDYVRRCRLNPAGGDNWNHLL